ncbi:hypothetical protein CARUB_v10003092mg [Capsella rubella]|uniref:Prolamin-like domain-containing protein n=1 Tax=Capsella rubella TaxID=81985 RepID=R0GRY7_9BRAS|nr:uncharacterized protein LOC17881889 [Capsella rubella]EOA19649.1 hypothetical protein CARUB_v10003092mg [Capsella rubella]
MKTSTILVAMILFTCCVTSQVAARVLESTPSLRDEKLQWWYHKPRFPFPALGRAFPPLPAGHFHPPPEVAKCLSDCKEVKTCFADITKAFVTHKPAIGSDCCAAIVKMKGDCEKTVFGSFHSRFFNGLVKRHCSNKVVSSAPAPSPA